MMANLSSRVPPCRCGRHGVSLLAAAAFMTTGTAVAQVVPPPAAAQNPSPMAETTRAHTRLVQRPFDGISSTITGPGRRPLQVRIPTRALRADRLHLMFHFHGAEWIVEQAIAALGQPAVGVIVNLGSGSGAYHRPFADPAAYDSLLAAITLAVREATGREPALGPVTLSGFSAGHGAIRAILLEPRHMAAVSNVLLLDGMHTSYVPERRVLADSGILDTTNLVALAQFARTAMRGEKSMLVTHSEIFPGTFASTTETADWMLGALGLQRARVLRWGPQGMQQLSEVRTGRFGLQGFAGNSAPDHVDHLHGLPDFLRSVTARR